MEYERNQTWDGFVSLERGVDGGRVPASLPRNQCAAAVNTTFRGGFPSSRPGWVKRPLRFLDSDGVNDEALMSAFQDGQFQGAAYYDGITHASSLITSIGGRVYRILPDRGFEIADITPTAANSSRLTKAWFCQAEEFMVVQDSQSRAIVFDGSTSWRLDKDTELPVGGAMAYGMGRIWVALPDGFSFIAGDLVYGSSGTPSYGGRDAVLNITENDFLNEGGVFAMPANSGGIRALTFTSNLDTSLGQGPLLAFTPNLVCSIQAPIDRNVWKSLQYPIQTVALGGYGALADTSTVTVNGDVFYRSTDGIRSFTLARREFGGWGNTPVSSELNPVLTTDTEHLLSYGSAVVFDNRLLITVSPYKVQGHGVPHRGLAVMDFDIISRISGKEQPAWEGVWTGLNVLALVKGMFASGERAFAFVLNGASQIELWELSRDADNDESDIGDSRITWSFEMKALDFESPFDLKVLDYGELFVDDIRGQLTVKAQFRPDGYAKWVEWHPGWSETAVDEMADPDTVTPPAATRKQVRSKMRFPRPTDLVDTVEGKPFRKFFTLQPRIELTGKGRVRSVRIAAHPEQEQARGEYRT